MTRLPRRASLLVAFLLLTSAATAYADCAWVLWQQQAEISPSGSVSSSDWTWLTAYPFPVIRATFRVPAPRPHPLALSGAESPVNLAFVEATYATGVADGVPEAGPHRR
jgi:hypothetical protein